MIIISLSMLGISVVAFLFIVQKDEIKNLKAELELQNKWISDLVNMLENK